MYEVVIDDGEGHYSRLWHKNRGEWKTKRIAEKHAREYKGNHLKDAWVQPVYDKQGNATSATYGKD
jgi:hypothetical protein